MLQIIVLKHLKNALSSILFLWLWLTEADRLTCSRDVVVINQEVAIKH